MYRIKTTIEGVAPILFNNWTEEAREQLDRGGNAGKKSITEREEEALHKVYRNGEGLFLPSRNLEACIVQGARKAGLKMGRASAAPYLEATVLCEQRELPFGVEQPDGIHEVIGRRPPKTGGAVVIRRPYLKEGWRLSATFTVTSDNVAPDQVHQALSEGGMLAGLCDDRPRYGRFVVKEWEIIK